MKKRLLFVVLAVLVAVLFVFVSCGDEETTTPATDSTPTTQSTPASESTPATESTPASESTPAESTESTPAESTESTPVESTESTPVESTESTPVESTESTPVESTESTPVESTESTPDTGTTSEPDTGSESEQEQPKSKNIAGFATVKSPQRNKENLAEPSPKWWWAVSLTYVNDGDGETATASPKLAEFEYDLVWDGDKVITRVRADVNKKYNAPNSWQSGDAATNIDVVTIELRDADNEVLYSFGEIDTSDGTFPDITLEEPVDGVRIVAFMFKVAQGHEYGTGFVNEIRAYGYDDPNYVPPEDPIVEESDITSLATLSLPVTSNTDGYWWAITGKNDDGSAREGCIGPLVVTDGDANTAIHSAKKLTTQFILTFDGTATFTKFAAAVNSQAGNVTPNDEGKALSSGSDKVNNVKVTVLNAAGEVVFEGEEMPSGYETVEIVPDEAVEGTVVKFDITGSDQWGGNMVRELYVYGFAPEVVIEDITSLAKLSLPVTSNTDGYWWAITGWNSDINDPRPNCMGPLVVTDGDANTAVHSAKKLTTQFILTYKDTTTFTSFAAAVNSQAGNVTPNDDGKTLESGSSKVNNVKVTVLNAAGEVVFEGEEMPDGYETVEIVPDAPVEGKVVKFDITGSDQWGGNMMRELYVYGVVPVAKEHDITADATLSLPVTSNTDGYWWAITGWNSDINDPRPGCSGPLVVTDGDDTTVVHSAKKLTTQFILTYDEARTFTKFAAAVNSQAGNVTPNDEGKTLTSGSDKVNNVKVTVLNAAGEVVLEKDEMASGYETVEIVLDEAVEGTVVKFDITGSDQWGGNHVRELYVYGY